MLDVEENLIDDGCEIGGVRYCRRVEAKTIKYGKGWRVKERAGRVSEWRAGVVRERDAEVANGESYAKVRSASCL